MSENETRTRGSKRRKVARPPPPSALGEKLQENCLQDAALVAEAHVKISKLTQELEKAQSEVKLGKINQEKAKILVEQARQEKYIVELKSTGEKASLKRKIEQLEMEFQQHRDRFNDAISEAEVDGYNKCVKKAKEKGLSYKKLLLDPSYDPIDSQQEDLLVPSSAEKVNNLDNAPDFANGVPVGNDSTATAPAGNVISPLLNFAIVFEPLGIFAHAILVLPICGFCFQSVCHKLYC